ncbi:N-acetylmuramoyl-L-alanine amidase [Bacillus wiedmannii]|uniref:N-acetylmuramoyl-L-alanine amidase n=1 Tax=Bacillus wiedmannii TaxID=1890302 RepID=UPI000BF0DB08|nr:N-acetylmuramoyl-L-alanine amidase [Bacillus wiedmannii]PEN61605.1 N-acetylmuramoyl-L-alanine amidase [Bacillus wiedmannii]
MNIKTDYLVTDPNRWKAIAPYEMNPTEITFHNTYNDASASAEVRNVRNNSTQTGFHVAVDDIEAQQVIPFYRNAFHAGDGNGTGNRKSIGIEICYSKSGGERYRKSELNAIEVISDLMVRFNIPISRVKTHQERNGKYCPHRMLAEGRVSWFKNECARKAEAKKNGSAPAPEPQPEPQLPSGQYDSSWFTKERGTFTLNTTINLRTAPFGNAALIATLSKGQSVNYDGYGIEQNGHVWIRQPRANGTYGYMATGESSNGKRVDYWGSFK